MTHYMPQDRSIAILHPHDPLLATYTKVTQQIFREIDINSDELWIGRVNGTPLVRVFFACIHFLTQSLSNTRVRSAAELPYF